MSRYLFDDARTAWQRSGSPLTLSVIVSKFIFMVLATFGLPIGALFTCDVPQAWSQPWRVVTYPWVSFDIMNVIFSGLAMFFFGGSLERAWGTRTFAIFFVMISVVTALGMTLGALMTQISSVDIAPWLVIAAIVVAWGTLNPFETILFWFVPIQGRWLAVIDVLIVFFSYARGGILLGLCALSGCAASYLWIRNRAWSTAGFYTVRAPRVPQPPRAKHPPRPYDDKFSWRDLNPFERIARARRKKQFERLFEDDK